MKNSFQIAGIIVLVFILGACKTASSSITKQTDGITEKYWKLVEINGKPLVWGDDTKREPHIILKDEGNRVIGNGGCNTLSGSYEIDRAANRIKFRKWRPP